MRAWSQQDDPAKVTDNHPAGQRVRLNEPWRNSLPWLKVHPEHSCPVVFLEELPRESSPCCEYPRAGSHPVAKGRRFFLVESCLVFPVCPKIPPVVLLPFAKPASESDQPERAAQVLHANSSPEKHKEPWCPSPP